MATKNETSFIGYDYQNVIVKCSMESVYTDGYTIFGWVLEETSNTISNLGSVIMKFKRDCNIRNKDELIQLQRQFEVCMSEIETMESSKATGAVVGAYLMSVIGTVSLAGSVFTYRVEVLPLSLILSVSGLACWIIPIFHYWGNRKRKMNRLVPLINQKYDEIFWTFDKANALLTE
ncbi:hypothetical protein [Paenibacillus donghaensis]|nr:hypothetical protein [Paenibacillus donghaensis]